MDNIITENTITISYEKVLKDGLLTVRSVLEKRIKRYEYIYKISSIVYPAIVSVLYVEYDYYCKKIIGQLNDVKEFLIKVLESIVNFINNKKTNFMIDEIIEKDITPIVEKFREAYRKMVVKPDENITEEDFKKEILSCMEILNTYSDETEYVLANIIENTVKNIARLVRSSRDKNQINIEIADLISSELFSFDCSIRTLKKLIEVIDESPIKVYGTLNQIVNEMVSIIKLAKEEKERKVERKKTEKQEKEKQKEIEKERKDEINYFVSIIINLGILGKFFDNLQMEEISSVIKNEEKYKKLIDDIFKEIDEIGEDKVKATLKKEDWEKLKSIRNRYKNQQTSKIESHIFSIEKKPKLISMLDISDVILAIYSASLYSLVGEVSPFVAKILSEIPQYSDVDKKVGLEFQYTLQDGQALIKYFVSYLPTLKPSTDIIMGKEKLNVQSLVINESKDALLANKEFRR